MGVMGRRLEFLAMLNVEPEGLALTNLEKARALFAQTSIGRLERCRPSIVITYRFTFRPYTSTIHHHR
jgi:hypothetical protein